MSPVNSMFVCIIKKYIYNLKKKLYKKNIGKYVLKMADIDNR